jgi:adenylylsulfate kinase-like enzyme
VSTTKELASSMATAHATSGQQVLSPPGQQHIWVITGPAGCGKTSVAESLHQTYGMPYLEGDTVSSWLLFFNSPINSVDRKKGLQVIVGLNWD